MDHDVDGDGHVTSKEWGKAISKHEAQRVRMGLHRALMHRQYALSPSP